MTHPRLAKLAGMRSHVGYVGPYHDRLKWDILAIRSQGRIWDFAVVPNEHAE